MFDTCKGESKLKIDWPNVLAGALAGAIVTLALQWSVQKIKDNWRSIKTHTKELAVTFFIQMKQLPQMLTWKATAILAIAALSIFLIWSPAQTYLGKATDWWELQVYQMKERTKSMRTRPVCKGNCSNKDWIVGKCEREAFDVGDLGNSFRHSVERATKYFRGCLVDKGLSWANCDKGEEGCRLFRLSPDSPWEISSDTIISARAVKHRERVHYE